MPRRQSRPRPGVTPSPPITTAEGTVSALGPAAAGKVAAAAGPAISFALRPFAASLIVQTIVIDSHAGGVTLFWDDIQPYVRTHNINLGPFSFISGDT